jgi:NitT/TauT family transport system substrate-binding protein
MSPQPPAADRSRLLPWLAAVVVGLGAAGALALGLIARGPRQLMVAISSWPGYEYLYLAEQKDLAGRFRLDLRVEQFSSLQDQRRAYSNGAVDVIATTVPEAIAICQESPRRCPQLVLVLDESVGADRLVARREIQHPEQLLGRRVGLEASVLGQYLLLSSFRERPVRLEQMSLIYDGPQALVRGLQAGQLDAIVTYAPHDVPLRDDERFHTLFSSAALPGQVVDVLAVDPVFARRHPDAVRALVRTWWAAQAEVRRNPGPSVALMASRQRMTAQEFLRTEEGLRYPGPTQQRWLLAADGPLARSMARMSNLMQKAGRIRPDAPRPELSTAYLEEP